MSKSAILTSLAVLALGYTKKRIGSPSKVTKFPTVTVSFMDWAHWFNFDEEVLNNLNHLRELQFTHKTLPNPFPEVERIRLHFNEIDFDESGIQLRMYVESTMKPNTFLDLKENRDSRVKMDELGGKLWNHITSELTKIVTDLLPPINDNQTQQSDYNAKYFEQYEFGAPEDWLAEYWNPEESELFEDTAYPVGFGKNELIIDLNERTYIFHKNRWKLIDENTFKKPNPSKLRRR